MSALRTKLILLTGAFFLGACGEAEPQVEPAGDLVVHLDPRLHDGTPTHEQIPADSVVVQSWRPEAHADAEATLAPWTLYNGVYLEPSKGKGTRLHLADYNKAEGLTHVILKHKGKIDADAVDAIDFDAFLPEPGLAMLIWHNRATGKNHRVDASTHSGYCRARFELAGHPAWFGQVDRVQVYLADRGLQSFDLLELRLLSGGLQWGAEPTVGAGDVGLLGFAGDLRRTWTTDLDVPMYAEVDAVPAGAALYLDVGLPRMPSGAELVHFRVDARRSSGGWFPVAERTQFEAGVAWGGLSGDLGAHAGEALQLRFCASVNAGPRGDDAPEAELRLPLTWWGAPRLAPKRSSDRRPNLILVTLDTLRRDHLGSYGGSVPTPYLDELGEQGLVFEDAWSAANSTLPSHTSLLTGLDVPSHGVSSNRATLAEGVPTLVTSLRARGYHTAGAVSIHHLQAAYSGLGRGFDRFLDVQSGAPTDGAQTVEALESWFEQWRGGGGGPLFLWVHLFDPHTPYLPPGHFIEEYGQRRAAEGHPMPEPRIASATIPDIRWRRPGEFLEQINSAAFAEFLYGAGVAYTDQLVGRLRLGLRGAGLDQNAAWAITADHGEALGENDVWYDHEGLFPASLQVPLLLRLPGGPSGRVTGRVGNLELARTLLDLAGEGPRNPGTAGELETVGGNLLDLHAQEQSQGPDSGRPIFFVGNGLLEAGLAEGPVHHIASKLEHGGEYIPLHYDVSVDPNCTQSLSEDKPELAGRYQERTLSWLAERSTGKRERAATSEAQEAQLEALGYGGGEDEEFDEPGDQ